MHKKSIDILTIISVNEIKTKGILFVNDNFEDVLNQEDDKKKMNHFWNHFDKYWMSSDRFIDTWNNNNYVGNKNALKHTNYGLE